MLDILKKKRNMEDSASFRQNIHRVGNPVKMAEAPGQAMHLRIALAQSGLKELEGEAISDPLAFCQEWRLAFAQLSNGKKIQILINFRDRQIVLHVWRLGASPSDRIAERHKLG